MRARTDHPHLDRVLGELSGVHRYSDYWVACCPSHGDQHPSLSVKLGREGSVVLKCHAGCKAEDVVEASGLEWQDFFLQPRQGGMRSWIFREISCMLMVDPIYQDDCDESEVWRGMTVSVAANILGYGHGPTMFSQWWGEQKHEIPESQVRDGTDGLWADGKIRVYARINTYRKGTALETRVWDMLIEVPGQMPVWLSDKIREMKSIWRARHPIGRQKPSSKALEGLFFPARFIQQREGILNPLSVLPTTNLSYVSARARGDPWRTRWVSDEHDVEYDDRRESDDSPWIEAESRTRVLAELPDSVDLHEQVRRNLGVDRDVVRHDGSCSPGLRLFF